MAFIASFLVVTSLYILWLYAQPRKNFEPYFLEKTFSIKKPFPLIGRVDVVWIDQKGILIVGDHKTRPLQKIYLSDIIQLSAYRLLLIKTQKKPVAPFGYIHFLNGSQRVDLLSEEELIRLNERRIRLLNGKDSPNPAFCRSFCKKCSHQSRCH